VNEYRLFSADSHVTMPDAAWQEYLDPQFRDQAPRIEVTDDGEFRVFEGQRTRINAIANMAGRKPEDYSMNVRRFDDVRSGAWDPVERIKDQDIDGVDAEVLYFGGPLATAKDAGLRLNSFRGYNRWLAEFCSHAPDRLLGMAAIPIDTPEVALAEITAAAEMGLRGVYVSLFPLEGSYGDPEWDPMWKTLVERKMPFCLHVGGRRGVMPRFGTDMFMSDLVVSKLQMPEAISELIFGLVLQKNPDLKVVSVEAQIGWISFVQYYMDHLWHKHRYWTNSQLTEEPSVYFKRQVFATFMEDPVGLRERGEIGVDNILWSNDYPHSETTWPNSKSLTDEWMGSFPDEEKQKILWKNCASVYGLL
jgi:predicted TIM-barrel fold metal-dependent hydrolase